MIPLEQRRILNEVKKKPQVTLRGLKTSLEKANIPVHESTICKSLNRQGVHGRTVWRKLLLYKKIIAACLKLASTLTNCNTTGKIFCRLIKQKLNYQHKNIIPGKVEGTS